MNTLTFKIALPSNVGTTLSINIIGTNLHVDWGDGTTTTQEPNTERIQETRWFDNFIKYWAKVSNFKSWTVTITGDITGVGTNCFQLGGGFVTEITLPEGLETIESYGLRYIKAEKVIIPSTVTNIDDYFLYQSGVKEVVFLTENLTRLNRRFLSDTTQVESVKLPEGLISFDTSMVRQGIFYNCVSLKTLEVPSTLEVFPISDTNTANFENVRLETLKMHGGPIPNPPITENTKIVVPLKKLQDFLNHSDYPDERDRYEVYGTSISEKLYIMGILMAKNLTIKNIPSLPNEGLTTLANKINAIDDDIVVFLETETDDFISTPCRVNVPSSVSTLSDYCFRGLINMSECILPPLNSIGYACFFDCFNLVSIDIDSISVGGCCFARCSNLTSITFSENLDEIGGNIFYECHRLKRIRFTGQTPPSTVDQNTFHGLNTDCVIEVPCGTLNAYQNTQYFPSSNDYTYVEYDCFFYNPQNWQLQINNTSHKVTLPNNVESNWTREFTDIDYYTLSFDYTSTNSQQGQSVLLFTDPNNDDVETRYSIEQGNNSKTHIILRDINGVVINDKELDINLFSNGNHTINIIRKWDNVTVDVDGLTVLNDVNITGYDNTIGFKSSDNSLSLSNFDLELPLFYDRCNGNSKMLTEYQSSSDGWEYDELNNCYTFIANEVSTEKHTITSLDGETNYTVEMDIKLNNGNMGTVALLFEDQSNELSYQGGVANDYYEGFVLIRTKIYIAFSDKIEDFNKNEWYHLRIKTSSPYYDGGVVFYDYTLTDSEGNIIHHNTSQGNYIEDSQRQCKILFDVFTDDETRFQIRNIVATRSELFYSPIQRISEPEPKL